MFKDFSCHSVKSSPVTRSHVHRMKTTKWQYIAQRSLGKRFSRYRHQLHLHAPQFHTPDFFYESPAVEFGIWVACLSCYRTWDSSGQSQRGKKFGPGQVQRANQNPSRKKNFSTRPVNHPLLENFSLFQTLSWFKESATNSSKLVLSYIFLFFSTCVLLLVKFCC